MKILFVAANFKPFEYPTKVIGGGTEWVEYQQISSLLAAGHEVTLAVTSDSTVTSLPFVYLPIESQATAGKYYLAKAIDFLDSIQEDYDRILTNKSWRVNLSSARAESLQKWAHKIRMINHEPPIYMKGVPGFDGKLATMKWMVGNGARLATVIDDNGATWDKIEEDLRSGKQFRNKQKEIVELLNSVPYSTFSDFYEVMVASEDLCPIKDFVEGDNIVYVSRPSVYKGINLAVSAIIKAEATDSFVGFTCTATSKSEQETWDKLAEKQKMFSVDASHSLIMDAMRDASAFLQPTNSESAGGIVALEAAMHGVPVITTTDTGRRYLKPYGLYNYVERSAKSLIEAIKTIRPLKLEERIDAATRVRADFSKQAYTKRLEAFLE